ncbi:hypothetical protein SAY87_003448 [Trapa incisa]|uniref:Uncharacterized protein n=1 Tax=Trapa incisa TaxID=236973 RepID=A0AAN7KSK0_9MYRT|nr:hypothetical protein SAY87_003448 [Trapa incisa]
MAFKGKKNNLCSFGPIWASLRPSELWANGADGGLDSYTIPYRTHGTRRLMQDIGVHGLDCSRPVSCHSSEFLPCYLILHTSSGSKDINKQTKQPESRQSSEFCLREP